MKPNKSKNREKIIFIIIAALIIAFLYFTSGTNGHTNTPTINTAVSQFSFSSSGTGQYFTPQGGFQQADFVQQNINVSVTHSTSYPDYIGFQTISQYVFNLQATECNNINSCSFIINTFYVNGTHMQQSFYPTSWGIPKTYINGLLASNGDGHTNYNFISNSQYTIVSCPQNATSYNSNGCTQPIIIGT